MSITKPDGGTVAILDALHALAAAIAATNGQGQSTQAKGGSIAAGSNVRAKRIAIDNRCVIHLHVTLPIQGPQ